MKMLMTIKVEGGSIEDYDFYDEAVHCWRSKKKQEEYKLYSSYQSHKTNHLIINSMVSVMTLIWKLNPLSSNC